MMKQDGYSLNALTEARERFSSLISAGARERAFQTLFTECPFIFSRSLPLAVDSREIVPLGRSGVSEPDFALFPRRRSAPYSYGAIELKRPDSKLVTVPRKDIVTLSRDAETAVSQLRAFAPVAEGSIVSRSDEYIFIGSSSYLFAIMGLSSELASKLVSSTLRARFKQLLPADIQIIPYDVLLRRFEETIPERTIVLVPTMIVHAPSTLENEGQEIQLLRGGDHDAIVRRVAPHDKDEIARLRRMGYRTESEWARGW